MITEVIEGLCWMSPEDDLIIQTLDEAVNFSELSQSWVGHNIILHIGFKIPAIPLQGAWGAGCCHWEGSGECPAGHHIDPGKMLLFQEEGKLLDEWKIETSTGVKKIPRLDLTGHDIRVFVLEKLSAEELQGEATLGGLGKLVDMLESTWKGIGAK